MESRREDASAVAGEAKEAEVKEQPPPPSAPAAAAAGRRWVSCKYGVGEAVGPACGRGRLAVRLRWATASVAAAEVADAVDVRVVTFYKGRDAAVLAGTSLSAPLGTLRAAVAAEYGVDVDAVRLVHAGREIAHDADGRAVGSCGLRAPFEVLFVHDESASFEFDPRHRGGEEVEVAGGGMSVTITSHNRWRTVRGTKEITDGRVFWDARLEMCQTGNMFLGVCTGRMKLGNYCGNDEHSFGYYGCSNVYNCGTSKKYGEPFRTGDMMRVIVDMNARTLSFWKNGVSLGVAFENLPPRVYPAFSLYSVGDTIRLEHFGCD